VDMSDYEDQAFRRRVRFGTSSKPLAADSLRRRGGPICGEGLPVWLSEFFV
jgi:hypothetical protein